MKKTLLITFLCVCLVGTYLYIDYLSFNPLKEKDFQILFSKYNINSEKICRVDFIGMSFHGEVFEIYLYKIGQVSIDSKVPKFQHEWENEKITGNTFLSKWKKCPIDTITKAKYEVTLTASNYEERKCSSLFKDELNNPKNYYSYIYFDDREKYFLLYCPDKGILYYVRSRGI